MITTKEKAIAAIQEAERRATLARLVDEPILRQGHLDVADIFIAIATDYAKKHLQEIDE